MSFEAQKQIRENTLELQEFLKDLKQWENRVKEKDKNLRSQSDDVVLDIPPVRRHGKGSSSRDLLDTSRAKTRVVNSEERQVQDKIKSTTAGKHTYDYFRDKWDKFDVDAALRQLDEDDSPSSSVHEEKSAKKKVLEVPKQAQKLGPSSNKQIPKLSSSEVDPVTGNGFVSMVKKQTLDSYADATNEKEMGNHFFKEKKFVKAIECYSRSIVLQPSAVSYANRAMAYIKIRRFEEAEADCTEAIALDDRYIKAYSRRATARRELGNIVGSVADAEFALRLEPDNKELKEQYSNAKALCEKMVRPEEKAPVHVEEVRTRRYVKLDNTKDNNGSQDSISQDKSIIEEEFTNVSPQMGSEKNVEVQKVKKESGDVFDAAAAASVVSRRLVTASQLGAPKNFYEFEASWKSFSSNSAQQVELLKVVNPSALPELFKDNLSPKLLGEILRSLQHFFPDNASRAIEFLEGLTRAKRFEITAMCLSSKEKTEIGRLWEEVFAGPEVDEGKLKLLSQLRPKFRL